MYAHRLRTTVTADHNLAIRLPDDFPTGLAEVVILAIPKSSESLPSRPLKPHPVLGKIVIHEDPALPLEPEDWPQSED